MSTNNDISDEEDISTKLKHPDDSIKTVKTKLSTNVSTFKKFVLILVNNNISFDF